MSAPIDDARLAEMQALARETLRPGCGGHDPEDSGHDACSGCYGEAFEVARFAPNLIAEVKRLRDGIVAEHRPMKVHTLGKERDWCETCERLYPCATAALIA